MGCAINEMHACSPSITHTCIHHVYMYLLSTPTHPPPPNHIHTLNPDFTCFVNEGLTEILKLTRDSCQCCFEALETENICNMKNIKKKNKPEKRIIQIQCVVYHMYLATKLVGVKKQLHPYLCIFNFKLKQSK